MRRSAILAVVPVILAAGAVGGCSGGHGPENGETVVLLHGLGRSSVSMALLATRLRDEGYRVVNVDYPSTSEPLEVLAARLDSVVDACCGAGPGTDSVHFVTHSMGGVVVRLYLSDRSEGYRGRVVMLSPPSQGSEIVDAFADSPILTAMLGPAVTELGTDSTGIAETLEPVEFELDVITGDRSWNPVTSWLIPGPDDGTVGVDEARVRGAAAFKVVPATHTFIMNRQDVADHVVHFLRTGEFLEESLPE